MNDYDVEMALDNLSQSTDSGHGISDLDDEKFVDNDEPAASQPALVISAITITITTIKEMSVGGVGTHEAKGEIKDV